MDRSAIEEIGGAFFFAGRTLRSALFDPSEVFAPVPALLRRMLWRTVPVLCILTFIVTFVLCLGGYSFFARLGTQPYFGLLIAILVFRFQGPFMVGLLFNATWTTLNTAEIAGRKINEEVDALSVMGVDPLREIIAPRILMALLGAPILTGATILSGYVAAVLATRASGLGSWVVNQWIQNVISGVDLFFSLLFGTLMCFIEIVVSCFQGLRSAPGAEGVRQAVTRNVVSNLYVTYVVSLVMTVVLQAAVWRVPA